MVKCSKQEHTILNVFQEIVSTIECSFDIEAHKQALQRILYSHVEAYVNYTNCHLFADVYRGKIKQKNSKQFISMTFVHINWHYD